MQDGQVNFQRLTGITASLASVRSVEALAKAIHDVVEDTVDVEYSGVYITDYATNQLRLLHTKGFSDDERKEAERTAWDRHPGAVIRSGEMLHVRDTGADPRTKDSKRTFQVRSRLWLPIVSDGRCVGALGLASSKLDAYSDEHLAVLQYASTTSGFMYKNLRDNWVLQQQYALAEEQRLELVALSSPLVEVWQGIIVLPIIGRVEEARAQQMTEKLLALVALRSIRAVILDMTGVATIDAASIEHLGRMHRAVRLLGSDCVFTGISGTTAALITDIGIDLGGWTTFANVRLALHRLSGQSNLTPKRTRHDGGNGHGGKKGFS